MGLFSILPSLYGSWSCSVAFLHICLIIDLRHCQQRWVYIEYISMCIWYILYVSFCFISCCRFDNNLHNECVLKKTSSVAFRESIGILANTHTQTDSETDTKPKRNIFQTCANFHAQTILRIRAEPRADAVCSSPSPATNMVN